MFYSPLRYPGGKGKLATFMEYMIGQLGHQGGTYIEPFAGGAGIAIELLLRNVVSKIVINDYEQTYGFWDGGDVSHASDHCGNSSNQVIYDRDNNGVGEAMVETGTDGLGTLECTIYTGYDKWTGRFTGQTSASQVHVDDVIYWTTSSGSRTWHHRGTVTATAEGHPNRS